MSPTASATWGSRTDRATTPQFAACLAALRDDRVDPGLGDGPRLVDGVDLLDEEDAGLVDPVDPSERLAQSHRHRSWPRL